uniref:Yippee domain-containing protein n=1 Tax=Meloidogyne hapla TaxID=6305 RepID=A0A1I8BJN7_MELHA
MEEIKTQLDKRGLCLTIIKNSGYFVCEVCKSIYDDIRNSAVQDRTLWSKRTCTTVISSDPHIG